MAENASGSSSPASGLAINLPLVASHIQIRSELERIRVLSGENNKELVAKVLHFRSRSRSRSHSRLICIVLIYSIRRFLLIYSTRDFVDAYFE